MTDRFGICTDDGHVSNGRLATAGKNAGCQLLRILHVHGLRRRDSLVQEHLDAPIPQSRPRWDMLSPYRERVRPNLPPSGNQSRFQLRGLHASRTRA